MVSCSDLITVFPARGYFDTGNLNVNTSFLQMVRRYKRALGSRSYKNYTDDAVNDALLEIVEGRLSILAASLKFRIPYGHLYNKFHGKNIHAHGHPTALPTSLERKIVQCLITCGEWGFPMSKEDLRYFVQSLLQSKGE